MAKVIEFHIPKDFRKPLRAVPQAEFGKVVEFHPETKKSA
jgi:hypothetical protein